MKNGELDIQSVNRDAVLQKLKDGKNLILFTENFSGHRYQWLKIMLSRLNNEKRSLIVFSLTTNLELQVKLDSEVKAEFCFDFETKRDLLTFIKPYSEINELITWDGDNWLPDLIRLNIRCRLIIMRPYLDYSSLLTLFKTGIKILLCHINSLFGRFDIAFLGVPLHHFRNYRANVVDDEVDITPNEFLEDRAIDYRSDRDFVKIILPGFISDRKNPMFAILAIEKIRDSFDIPIILMLLGSVSNSFDLSSFIAARDWVQVNNKYHDRESFLSEIESADLIILPYSNKASSSVAIESMTLGTRVLLAQDKNWTNLRDRNPNLLYLSPLKLDKFSQSISQLILRRTDSSHRSQFTYRSRQLALDYLLFGKEE